LTLLSKNFEIYYKIIKLNFYGKNINFYMAVEEYRKIPDSEKRAEMARQIFERHFTLNSAEPVNIDNSTSKTIKDAVLEKCFTANLYDVAQYQIFHLLKYDCWPRYLRSGGVAPTFDDTPDENRATQSLVQSNQTGSTIDPARQAMDALNNRCVRLMPVLYFAADIIVPQALTKTGGTIILLRARHGLSSTAVLKPVLNKFSVDFDNCIVVFSGSLDVISPQAPIGHIGQKCVTVMTQQQYQERLNAPKRETNRDCLISPHYLSAEINLPFYQHGDVAFVELPVDFDIRTGKMNATRMYSNAKVSLLID
uniref:RGS domain-containing protein n=1 Tax=Dracunculus medinensis TaxID=318479 RepID=A0A158Q5D1_DRAME